MKIELEKPGAGWSSLKIDDGKTNFIGALSYVDDVTGIFLSKFNQYLDGEDVILTFDEEGTEFSIIMKHYDKLMIISEREKYKLHVFNIWSDDIIKPICEEILKNYEDWIKFDIFCDDKNSTEFKEEYLANKKFIDENIRKLAMNMKGKFLKEEKAMEEHKVYDTLNPKEREIVEKLRKSPNQNIASLFELPFIVEDMLDTDWDEKFKSTEKEISENLLGALKDE